jgi:hypothetical protein
MKGFLVPSEIFIIEKLPGFSLVFLQRALLIDI